MEEKKQPLVNACGAIATEKEFEEAAKRILAKPDDKSFIKAKKEITKIIFNYFGKRDLSKQILSHQPLHYDKGKNWWMWNEKGFFWEIVDETDIMNMVGSLSTANTVNAKEKNEILEALKQEARIRMPLPISKKWIQFKDVIYNLETGKVRKATPKYFVTNPIPWEIHKFKYRETPNMDRIFEEWVGKEYVQTLYEIIAYCLLPDYPIHRLFCLTGNGGNGKTCFLNILRKFIGMRNVTSTELDLLLNSRFEVTKLHKKLVCLMGETNFNELNKTSIIKKLTGQDTLGFEYKNKNPFDDFNYAKIILATNNLPITTDKTFGFYRRWCIIDFPNNFSEKKEILKEIPNEEYECLALKSVMLLKDILEERRFTREGTVEDRMKKYEEKSNPLEKFWKENILEDLDSHIFKYDFREKLDSWCRENKFRVLSDRSIVQFMRDKEVGMNKVQAEWHTSEGKKPYIRAWLGIKWR